MKKLFLIAASLSPFALHALAPDCGTVKTSNESEVALPSLPKKTVAECEAMYAEKFLNGATKAKSAQEAAEITVQLWEELQDCKKEAELPTPVAEAELPTLEIPQASEVQ